MALDANEMARLEAFGAPAFLIVPNDHHRLDAKAWKDRYPQVQVVAPEGARARIARCGKAAGRTAPLSKHTSLSKGVAAKRSGDLAGHWRCFKAVRCAQLSTLQLLPRSPTGAHAF